MWLVVVIVILVLASVVYEIMSGNFSWAVVILQILFLGYALFQFNQR
ncbi:hypothetical protein LFYK43_19530 [Ligilactobacillus salitolerans]|uniref:Uncharacterized protein n=2 Tax=Ligilactobacillus salitolerans TaxID=1808352 RepID=A0A401IVC9_9LACO|nr:hypothetical protein LFYK43_19530 [Ligilactobacillus salitolerans]